MALFKIRKSFCFGVLLLLSSFSHANSPQNIYGITSSILSYVKWNIPAPSFCVVDNVSTVNTFNDTFLQKNLAFKAIAVSSNNLSEKKCDAIFFSQFTPSEEQKLINVLKAPPALSFSANNTECELGSVFCLYTSKSGKSSFKVNLDSLARTKIHLDPRVLLLAQKSE